MRTSLWVSVFLRFALAGLVFVGMAHADGVVPDLLNCGDLPVGVNCIAAPQPNLTTWPPASSVYIWRERETYAPNLMTIGGVSGVPVNLDSSKLFSGGALYGPNAARVPFTGPPTDVTGVVPAGTLINSYLIHARNTTSTSVVYAFNLQFNFPVLGVIALNTQTGSYFYLDGSDSSLGYPGVTYPDIGLAGRGFDVAHGADWIQLDDTKMNLTVSLRIGGADSGTYYDQIRILTAAPEPAAIALFGTVAAVLLGAVRWRKRRARS